MAHPRQGPVISSEQTNQLTFKRLGWIVMDKLSDSQRGSVEYL